MEPNWVKLAWACLCVFWLLLLAGLIALVVWLISRSKPAGQPSAAKPESGRGEVTAPPVSPKLEEVSAPVVPAEPVVEVAPAVVKPEPVAAVPPDDLEKIEGIGPKIAKVLQEAGITTFAALAATSPERLRAILDQAGIRRISDPATWPEQARLAAEGKLQELEAFQSTLKAGRRTG